MSNRMAYDPRPRRAGEGEKMRTCATCGRSVMVTDAQINDLVARQAAILRDLGGRLDYTEAEVCTMVNLATPHEGVAPVTPDPAAARDDDVNAVMAQARHAAGPQPRCQMCGRFCYWTGWQWACRLVFTSDEGWSEHD